VKKNNSFLEIQDTKVEPNNVNLQVDENFIASLNSSSVQTSIASFIDVALRGKSDGQEKELIGDTLRDIKPLDTLSPL
jgi:hypothetical protein